MAFSLTNSYRLFKVESGSTLVPLGHAQDNSFSMSADEINVSTKDTPFGQSETIAGTISSTTQVSGLVFEGDTIGIREILTAIKGRETWEVVFQETGTAPVTSAVTIAGDMVWLSGDVNSNGNAGVVEYSGSGKFTGDVIIS